MRTSLLHARRVAALAAVLVLLASPAAAQTGPGGVGTTDGSSSLELWLKADDLSLANGASVTSWNDASGHGENASAGNAPTFATNAQNGQPAVRFDGSNDYMTIPSFPLFSTSSSGLTVFTVFKPDAIPGQRFVLMQPQVNCFNNFELGYRTGNTGDGNDFGIHAGCSRATVTQNPIVDTNWHLYSTQVLTSGASPSNVRIFQDGTAHTVEKEGNGYVGAGSYGTAVRKLILAARDDNNNNGYNSFHDGDIAEVVIFSEALNSARRTLVENYLSAKYALAISNDRYNSATYITDVAGIGKESDGSATSGASGGLTLTNSAFLADNGDYLMFGHDGSAATLTSSDLPSGATERWGRIWYVDKTDAAGTSGGNVTLTFDRSDAGLTGNADAADFFLLFRSGTSGAFAKVTASATNVSGDQVTLTVDAATLADGYYTLGRTTVAMATLPGGGGSYTLSRSGNTLTLTDGGGFTQTYSATGTTQITITGSTGNDAVALDFSGGDPVPADGITFNGGDGDDTLTGGNAATAWAITSDDAGTATSSQGTVSFTGVENLVGNAAGDTFTFSDGADVSSVDGQGGSDAMNFAAYTSGVAGSLSGTGTADGFKGTLAGISFDNIASLTGGSATDALTGLDAAATWAIGATDSYTASGRTLTLTGFETRTGGSGVDAFTVTGANVPTGASHTLNGGDGADTFTLDVPNGSGLPAGITSITVNGGGPASNLGSRDIVTVNDGGGARTFAVTYPGGASGDLNISGIGTAAAVALTGIELFDYNGDAANDDAITVNTTAGDDDLTVKPTSASAANIFFNGSPFGTPGVADGAPGPDLELGGLADLTLDGKGGTGDELYYDGTAKVNVTGTNSGDIDHLTLLDLDFASFEDIMTSGLASICVEAPNGDDGAADAFVVSQSGGNLVVMVNGQAIFMQPYSQIGVLTVLGSGDDDHLTLDFANGSPIPASGLVFTAAGQQAGGDAMTLNNGSFTNLTHTFTNNHDGSIDFDGALVQYTGLEPIDDNSAAVNRIFTFNGGAETITLGDDGDVGDDESVIDSDQGESVTFVSPSGTLTLNTGSGSDDLTVDALDEDFEAAITINGGNAADVIVFNQMDLQFDQTVTINGDGSGDQITVTATRGSGAYTINGGGEADVLTTSPTKGTGAFIVNGDSGNDTFHASTGLGSLVTTYQLNGEAGDDVFHVTPSGEAPIAVDGGGPTTFPGDVLDLDVSGTSDELITYTSLNDGTWTFGSGEMNVTFTNVEFNADTPDLQITKTITDFDEPFTGDLITFQFVLKNLDPLVSAAGIRVEDVLHSKLDDMFVAAATNGTPAFDSGDNTIDWTDIDMPVGASDTLTFKVKVVGKTASQVTNTATVLQPDQDLGNSTHADVLDIQPNIRFPENVVVQAAGFWEDEAAQTHALAGTYQFGMYRGIPASYFTTPRWATDANDDLPAPLIVNDLLITQANEIIISTWGYAGTYRSADGGRTWTDGAFPAFDDGDDDFKIVYSMDQSPVNGWLYASADRGRIFRSLDGGTTWDYAGLLPGASADTPWAMVADAQDENVVYAGTFGRGVYRSPDKGETWAPTPDVGLGEVHVFDLEFDPANLARLYAATAVGLYYTDDAGQTWTSMNDGLTAPNGTGTLEIRDIAFSPDPTGPMFVATWGFGVYVITDRSLSTTWTGFELESSRVMAISFDPGSSSVLVATEGDGAAVIHFDPSKVVSREAAGEVPTTHLLDQNYPNPFNPVTTIRFALPEAEAVRLAVYDALGREIAVLAAGVLPAGQHTATFDAGDHASGLYLYRLETATSTLTRTMVLLK